MMFSCPSGHYGQYGLNGQHQKRVETQQGVSLQSSFQIDERVKTPLSPLRDRWIWLADRNFIRGHQNKRVCFLDNSTESLRLQKFLAQCGIGSRRFCETLVAEGRITVNGQKVTERGFKVDPERDQVLVDGRPVEPNPEQYVILMNKPKGYITTRKDPHGAPNVFDLLPEEFRLKVFSIGRLDKDTEGLLLFSNRGDLAFQITHPKHYINKTYQVWIKGVYEHKDLKDLEQGILLGDRKTAPAKISKLKHLKNKTSFFLTIHEGRKRQIRRMCKALKLQLIYLKRYQVGPIHLGDLETGKWRFLGKNEINELEKSI